MPQAHSKYGASTAERWLNCPGSIQLSETVPPLPTSEDARKGTAAHKLGEICLLENTEPSSYLDQEIKLDDGTLYMVDQTMIDGIEVYVDYVRQQSKIGESFIETKFSLDFVHEGMFGTNDASIFSKTLGMLEVIDYKNGYKYVSPEENKQLAYYGLGASHVHDLHPDSQIKLTVVQPNSEGEAIKSWITTVGYLKKYAQVLKKGVKATKVKNPKLKEGDWCTFCPAFAVCPQLRKVATEVAKTEFSVEGISLPDPTHLKPVDIKKVLDSASLLSSWLKAVEAYAFNELENGRPIEGYKLVAKRANRRWKDKEAAEKYFRDDVALGDKVYTKPEFLSPAQIEKLKVSKDLVARYTETPDNGNTMASVSDKRPEVIPSVLNDFSSLEDDSYYEEAKEPIAIRIN